MAPHCQALEAKKAPASGASVGSQFRAGSGLAVALAIAIVFVVMVVVCVVTVPVMVFVFAGVPIVAVHKGVKA